MIKAVDGRELSALAVFTKSLEYMKRIITDDLDKRIVSLSRIKIKWILTVPAIWSPGAIQIMREAATEVSMYAWYYFILHTYML